MNTFVRTGSLPNLNSLVGAATRCRAIVSAGPNDSAWLGQTVAHIGRKPTDVRS